MEHEGIYTFADCPHRLERIKTRDEVLLGYDWQLCLCPNTCPLSMRNSDYSECQHDSLVDKTVGIRACRLGGNDFTSGSGIFRTHWCEALLAINKCPRGYVR